MAFITENRFHLTSFIAAAVTAFTAHAAPTNLVARTSPLPGAPKTGETYSIILLGDTHFDGDYHKEFIAAAPGNLQRRKDEFDRNSSMWTSRMPRLLDAAKRQVRPDTKMVVQVGDLVQGDTGAPAVHSRMIEDGFAAVKSRFPDTPVLVVPGNHDIRGKGAATACRVTFLKLLSKELGRPVKDTTYAVMQGPDLFLFVDFNNPNTKLIRAELAKHADARYKFVVSHGHVIPSDNKSCGWMLYGRNATGNMRREMREIFLKNDVIALVGHSHTFEFTEVATETGRISQIVMNSVWTSEALATPIVRATTPAEYGKFQKDAKTGKTNKKGLALLNEYKPALTRYFRASAAGSMVLEIGPGGVTGTFYGGDSAEPSKTFQVR